MAPPVSQVQAVHPSVRTNSTFTQDVSRAIQASSDRPKYASYVEHSSVSVEHPPPPPPSPVGFPTSKWDAFERKKAFH